MDDLLTRDGIKWIINSILESAQDVVKTEGEERSEFKEGMLTAYYIVLNIIKSRIIIREGEPAEYDLDFDLDNLRSELSKRIQSQIEE